VVKSPILKSLLWDVTQHRLVVSNILGQPFGRIFKAPAFLGLLDPWRWDQPESRNVGTTTNLCCVISQKREDLTADAWNNAHLIYRIPPISDKEYVHYWLKCIYTLKILQSLIRFSWNRLSVIFWKQLVYRISLKFGKSCLVTDIGPQMDRHHLNTGILSFTLQRMPVTWHSPPSYCVSPEDIYVVCILQLLQSPYSTYNQNIYCVTVFMLCTCDIWWIMHIMSIFMANEM
jgi:hypothetical protein